MAVGEADHEAGVALVEGVLIEVVEATVEATEEVREEDQDTVLISRRA